MKANFLFILITFFILALPIHGENHDRIYDSNKGSIEELSGDWEFSCSIFQEQSEIDITFQTMNVPSSWRGVECNKEILSATGRYRYKLILTGDARQEGLSLFLPVAGTSMIAYWNGVMIHEAGDYHEAKPGFNPATVAIPYLKRNELIIDVANFNDRFGGLWHAPLIGNTSELQSIRKLRLTADLFISGLLIFFGLYTIFIFLNIRNILFLFIGIFSLGISIRNLVEGERILHLILGQDWWYFLVALAHLSIYLSFPFLYIFIKILFNIRKWKWVSHSIREKEF